MDYTTRPYFYGTGRRKSSVARVRLYAGTGSITINGRGIDDYFGLETLKLIVRQPLNLTGTTEKFDIECRVAGGGVTVNDEKVTSPDQEVSESDFGSEGLMLRKGKKSYHRILLG